MTIKNLIENELKIHPKAKTVDFYKLFYQATFGPAHILQNRQKAFDYLEEEIKLSSEKKQIQDISFLQNDYVRVDLGLINNTHNFFNILIKSANLNLQYFYDWQKIWSEIKDYLKDLYIPNFKEDIIKIDNAIKEGKPIFSHSAIYKKLYTPHYRVVSKQIWLSS